MHTLNSNALLEDLLFRCYHIYNINLTKGMKEMVNKLEQLSQTAISDLLLKLEAKLDADVSHTMEKLSTVLSEKLKILLKH